MIKKILNHIMQYTGKFCELRKKQLLLYFKNLNNVEKNKMMKILKRNFALLKKKLIVIISIKFVIDEIDENIIHATLIINALNLNHRNFKSNNK